MKEAVLKTKGVHSRNFRAIPLFFVHIEVYGVLGIKIEPRFIY